MILALTSDIYDRGKIYDAASTIIQQRLLQIQGVGQVSIGGSSLTAVGVDVNPTQLNNLGLGLEDVRTMLSRQNATLPKGQLADDKATADILANDQLLKAEDYQPLIVSYHNGAAVRLSDVANVRETVENTRAAGFLNGKPSISLIIFRQPGANIIETMDRVKTSRVSWKKACPQWKRRCSARARSASRCFRSAFRSWRCSSRSCSWAASWDDCSASSRWCFRRPFSSPSSSRSRRRP